MGSGIVAHLCKRLQSSACARVGPVQILAQAFDLTVMLLGGSVALLGYAVSLSGYLIALLGLLVALEGHLGPHQGRRVAIEGGLGALRAGELMASRHLRTAPRMGVQIAIGGGLVSLRGSLVGISQSLVPVGRTLVGVRGGLIGVSGGLIGSGGRLIGLLPSSILTLAHFASLIHSDDEGLVVSG
jgi:hypothetical protein